MKKQLHTLGAIDLHFHGAFGIDVMSASQNDLLELSAMLWKAQIAGFCPTTVSASHLELLSTVKRLGTWIQKKSFPGAIPIGIHLEGPYIHQDSCGAHPPHTIRKLNWKELEELWEASQKTLKIITLAPETLSNLELKRLCAWATKRRIRLSLGHSQATESQALRAFQNGLRGVTHAWNALPFHHREPGALGAALGRKDVSIELIIDQVHVSPTLIRWTRKLHPHQQICFISDCLSGKKLGDSPIRFRQGACRFENGQLAGGGRLLTDSYLRWVQQEAIFQQESPLNILKSSLIHITHAPLKSLGIPLQVFQKKQVEWRL